MQKSKKRIELTMQPTSKIPDSVGFPGYLYYMFKEEIASINYKFFPKYRR
jgi:hypothetical protein